MNALTTPTPEPMPAFGQHTLFTALIDAARRFGHRPGQWQDMKPASYGHADLVRMTLALARLGGKISAPGEHVGLLLPNLAPSVALLIGLSANGRVPCLLNYSAGVEAMRCACRTAGIRTVLSSRVFLDKAGLTAQAEALAGEVEIIHLEDLRRRFGWLDKLWLFTWALPFPLRALPPGDPEDPAVVLFTSGSEGRPKGVVLSHRALLANVAQILAATPISPDDHFLSALPIFHAFGLTAGVLTPLLAGAKVSLYPTPLHYKAIPALVGERGCTVLFGTGTFLRQYALAAEPGQLASLRLVVAGAEKLAEPVRALWRDRFGIDILEGYGTTEAAPVISVNRPGANRPGTVGPLLPGIEARLMPVAGIERGGELNVRGPNLMSGYYLPDAPGQLHWPGSAAGPGWYATGDVAEFDAAGHLCIVGRLKRFAKIAGEMVALDLAEAIAAAAAPDADHAAVSVPDRERGEAIVLFTTAAELDRDALVAAARRLGHSELALARRVVVTDTLPVLGSGKVDYVALHAKATAT